MSIDDRLKKLGVSRKTIAELYEGLDFGAIISRDEFNRAEDKLPKDEQDKGYQMRAIERMIRDNVLFISNANIVLEMFEHIVGSPACPRDTCTHLMKFNSSGGGSAGISITYKCEDCGAEIEIKLLNEAITYRPPPKKSRRK